MVIFSLRPSKKGFMTRLKRILALLMMGTVPWSHPILRSSRFKVHPFRSFK